MTHFDFQRYPLWLNIVVFLAAAVVVWIAGTHLTRKVEAIAERTGLGRAFLGFVLLGGIVSLPELSTATTSALAGSAEFAVNTLLGGIAATMVAIAIVDALKRERPVSTDIANPVVLLQGTLAVLYLLVVAMGIIQGDVPLLGAGVWTFGLLVLYLLFVRMLRTYELHRTWAPEEEEAEDGPPKEPPEEVPAPGRASTARLLLTTALVALAAATGGILLSRTGDAIAAQTGIGAGFAGILLGGIATTLPEVSTIWTAVRANEFEIVFSDAYGSNLFSTMAIFVVDVAYPRGPVLNEIGEFGVFAVLVGGTVSAIFLAGCIERRNRAILGMGIDSLLVLLTYAAGMILLFRIR